MLNFRESISFLPSPPPAMEEGCGSVHCLPGRCQDHSFPNIGFPFQMGLYLQPLQQCVTTAECLVWSCAVASPPTAYLTTLLVLRGSQHHPYWKLLGNR